MISNISGLKRAPKAKGTLGERNLVRRTRYTSLRFGPGAKKTTDQRGPGQCRRHPKAVGSRTMFQPQPENSATLRLGSAKRDHWGRALRLRLMDAH